jgi:hypothetical protein
MRMRSTKTFYLNPGAKFLLIKSTSLKNSTPVNIEKYNGFSHGSRKLILEPKK